MKALQSIGCWTVAVSLAAMVAPQARGQEGDPNKITEQDKKVYDDVVKAQKTKARQLLALTNAREIGMALFQFGKEYGAYPDDKTAAELKTAMKTTAEVKAVTANDCFFQLIAANIVQTDRIFSIDVPAVPEKQKPLAKLDNCFFAYLPGGTGTGNPGRPLLVAPLVNGKTTFDPQIFAGKGMILFCDNRVKSFPIEPDGRVMMNGKDIFDPAQPFWNGKVPPIKWPQK